MNRKNSAGLALAGAALAAFLVAMFVFACRRGEQEARLERLTPSPIVLLHGLGGDGRTWSALTGFLRSQGLSSGGVVGIGAGGQVEFTAADVPPARADFFSLEISNPYQSLQGWTSELERLLSAIHRRTRASRVVLVGHSAGGLTGRRYLVEHPGRHHVAKLVTLSSPHRGSGLALLPLFLQKIRDSMAEASGEGGFLAGAVNGPISKIEQRLGIPFDAPILPDLLPERLNPGLTALNGRDHPGVEYECLRALGGATFKHWEEMEQVVAGEIPVSRIDLKACMKDLTAFLQGDNGYQGDGAVTVASQDLRRTRFFQRRPELVQECRGVEVGHSEIREQFREILFAITSPVRFLRAGRSGDALHAKLTVDFHDYFAGLARVEARDARGGAGLPVSRPALFLRPGEAFGRVEIGPFDARHIQAVDVVVTSLDGRRHGRRILLSGAPGPERREPEGLRLQVLGVEGIPLVPGSLLPFPWDDDGSRADLQVLLFVDGEEVLRSPVHENVGAAMDLRETADLEAGLDLDEAWIVLELWDVDPGEDPEPIGRRVLSPGKLPRGEVAVRTDRGPILRLRVAGPPEKRIRWEREPIRLAPGPVGGR